MDTGLRWCRGTAPLRLSFAATDEGYTQTEALALYGKRRLVGRLLLCPLVFLFVSLGSLDTNASFSFFSDYDFAHDAFSSATKWRIFAEYP